MPPRYRGMYNPGRTAQTTVEVIPMSKKEKNRRKQTATDAWNNGTMESPGSAVTEELRRPRETPGDRAIDVLDNHTPDIDL